MKTREEVEALKKSWLKDPCWDLADSATLDGFGEYAVELAGFEVEHRALWQASREKAAAEAYRNTPASEATLRDVFAAHALQGELAAQSESDVNDRWLFEELAKYCFKMADAMMAARKKEGAA